VPILIREDWGDLLDFPDAFARQRFDPDHETHTAVTAITAPIPKGDGQQRR
jgi:hypothetical protein